MPAERWSGDRARWARDTGVAGGLAEEPEGARELGLLAEAALVAELGVHAVDRRLDTSRPGHQDQVRAHVERLQVAAARVEVLGEIYATHGQVANARHRRDL